MNFRMIAHFLRMVLMAQAVFMLVPMIFCMADADAMGLRGFGVSMGITLVLVLILSVIREDSQKPMYIKDGFVVVAVCWVVVSLLGALPYWVSREIPSFIDAFFESVSGFTTTGATILDEVESLSRGMLFWRGFSHWLGGMGVLMFLVALVPAISGGERSVTVMRAESSGPTPGKLVPKLRQSAKILYGIYISLTLALMLAFVIGGMPLFDSLVNTFSIAGTGGFSARTASIAAYDSAYIDVISTVFMIVFGVSFNVYYFMLMKNTSAIVKNEELRVYFGVIGAAILMVTLNVFGTVYPSLPEALRHASFQVTSVITSTGFATTDYNLWPTFSKVILFTVMFIGGCSGSTACGIKIARIIMLAKESKRFLFRMVHPRSVETVKLDGKAVDKSVVHAVNAFFTTFMMVYFLSLVLLSLNNFDFETTVTAAAACLNNVGPGFGVAGPSGSYSAFSAFSKLVLCMNMLLGRLELYPILLLFSPRTWKRI